MKVSKAIELLQNGYKPNDEIAMSLWSIDDVTTRCDEMGVKLTKKQKKKVLMELEKADANIGINWDSIDFEIEEIIQAQKLGFK